ncbi:hypothetical protein D9M72_519510 [compost metagenome]
MKVRTRNIQRNVWRVDNAFQHRQEFRNDSFYIIRYIYLILVQLDFIFLNLQIACHFWEIQNSCQVKRIVYVQMDVEKRLFELHRIQFSVEIFIIVFRKIGWLFCPSRIRIVDDVVYFNSFGCVVFWSIFWFWKRFCPSTKFDWNWHEFIVFLQQSRNFPFF